jgi:hypothetical protein
MGSAFVKKQPSRLDEGSRDQYCGSHVFTPRLFPMFVTVPQFSCVFNQFFGMCPHLRFFFWELFSNSGEFLRFSVSGRSGVLLGTGVPGLSRP